MSHDADPHEQDPTRTASTSASPASPEERASDDELPLAHQHDPRRYRILGEHGRGGLGKVTRAHDRHLGRDIAIKELIAHTELGELRFQREALITARLEHPGIVPVHEAGRWPDGTPFYAMKLVAGRPLRALIAERTSVADRLSLLHHVIVVADAMAYAHGRGVIHRDLKPANVIVGDFGETVVIDWGLAKDLGAADELPGAPSPSPDSPDLTSAGSVLGTPAYMAPEQARGESVDPRADVFAIGAMLWELCSLDRVPPADRRARDRLLRRNHIDRDLIAIIDKALARDRDHRYPDASALAADLKAFKAGARIASIDYSLFATLAHWARRHRAIAGAIAAAVLVLAGGVALYIHGIATERDRADRYSNDLLLSNAEARMQRDPTEAAALLRRYAGEDRARMDMLQVEARARGAALRSFHVDTEAFTFPFGAADGSIFAAGAHKSILKILPSGETITLAHYTSSHLFYDHSRAGDLVAYNCEKDAICVLDSAGQRRWSLRAPTSPAAITGLCLSPNGTRIAAITGEHNVLVWQLVGTAPPTQPNRLELTNARWCVFLDDDAMLTRSAQGLAVLHTEAPQPQLISLDVEFNGSTWNWDRQIGYLSSRRHVVVGTASGDLQLVDASTGRLVTTSHVCAAGIFAVRTMQRSPTVAYTCHDGEAGIWDAERDEHTSLLHHGTGLFTLAIAPDDCCLYLGGYSGELLAYDLHTQRLTRYNGHSAAIFVIQAPSRAFPYILSADSSGDIRIWAPPSSDVRLLSTAPAPFARAVWMEPEDAIVTIDAGGAARWYWQGRSGAIGGHRGDNRYFSSSLSPARYLAAFGAADSFEFWTLVPAPSLRVFKLPGERVHDVAFLSDGEHAIVASVPSTVGARLLRLSLSSGHSDVIAETDDLISRLRPCSNGRVVALMMHSLGVVSENAFRVVGRYPATLTAGECAPDGAWFAHGSATGEVMLHSMVSDLDLPLYQATTAVNHLAFSPDGRELAILSANQVVVRPLPAAPTADRVRQARLARPLRIAAASRVTYSSDGIWLAVACDNGDVWFYRRADDSWRYRSAGDAELVSASFSPDGRTFMTAGTDGKLLLYDMAAIGRDASTPESGFGTSGGD